jgi:hypothetical protein
VGVQSREITRGIILMDRDRYFVERCKNLPRKQRQTILLLEYRVQIFYLKAEDNPHPSNRVRVVNLTV